MQLKCIFSLALFYLSLTFVLNFCLFCCILLPSYELNQLDKIPQTCLERWGEHHQTGSSSSALNLGVLVHSHILLSPLSPNKTHQSSIMNDFPKGICHGTPPHSLLIHLSFQRVKMNSSLSILDGTWRELCDLTITDCEDWQIDCLWTLSLSHSFTLNFPSVFNANAHTSSLFSFVFLFSSIISITSHRQDICPRTTIKASFRPSETGKPTKMSMWGIGKEWLSQSPQWMLDISWPAPKLSANSNWSLDLNSQALHFHVMLCLRSRTSSYKIQHPPEQ